MSDLYTSLQVSPRKKRCPPELDDNTATPKKLRTVPPTPPATESRKNTKFTTTPLPAHLSRLLTIQTGLQHALSHALATCAVSPSSDTGLVRNVLNHFSLTAYTGLTTQFDIDDLRRLCWIWEWDGKAFLNGKRKPTASENNDDNPFLETQTPSQPKDWTRGSMGLVLSPTTHFSKVDGKRVPAYGIGIEIEMDIDKDMGGGMAAVARWTAAAETRQKEFRLKLDRWAEFYTSVSPIPHIPLADLPTLNTASKTSSLTRILASASPKASSSTVSIPVPPSSPSRSPSKSPRKRSTGPREFAVPFPVTPSSSASKSPLKNSLLFPQTPSSRYNRPDPAASLLTPRTPSTSISSGSNTPSDPSTPVHQRGANATTVPQTPTTSRRQALYERVRQRSLTTSPTKTPSSEVVGGKLTRDQILKMGQEEMRRRCLLGRLGGVAESVWMLFSTPATGSASTPIARKRRALPTSEVATAIVKSSPVPISSAEANESLVILAKLCPFFLKQLNIAGQGWLEMPASSATATSVEDGGAKQSLATPPSPGSLKKKNKSAEELVTRSPRRVKREAGGLREVREIIRRELELQD